MNLNRFIRVFRMEKAKELLRTTNMKVAMVSEQVGFANSSYFCRSFREYYGSSPESYRKGQYLVANAFWNVSSNLQVGVEYLRGWRTDFSSSTRHANRLNMLVQYSF